ncbi:MAG: hypothetical protein U0P45_15685 [Acidimicrobiales bacterium]
MSDSHDSRDAHDEDIDGDGDIDATITVTTHHVDDAGHEGGDNLEVVTVEELDLDGDEAPTSSL